MDHIPVLLSEIVDLLNPIDNDRFIDGTFGYGGHSEKILNSSFCSVLAIDRDPAVITRAEEFQKKYGARFEFKQGKFSEVLNNLDRKFNKILFDFGVSSMQLDQANRGFSFQHDGPLDMRMSQEGMSAYDLINNYKEEELAEIIWKYGDEQKSRKIAKYIVESRNKIKTTKDLHDVIIAAIGNNTSRKIDGATKTFQAFRIFINDELKEINNALNILPKILENNSLIATISFHSLEDRIVKYWAKNNKLIPITKKPITPTEEEIKNNPRARSAKLRVYKLG